GIACAENLLTWHASPPPLGEGSLLPGVLFRLRQGPLPRSPGTRRPAARGGASLAQTASGVARRGTQGAERRRRWSVIAGLARSLSVRELTDTTSLDMRELACR